MKILHLLILIFVLDSVSCLTIMDGLFQEIQGILNTKRDKIMRLTDNLSKRNMSSERIPKVSKVTYTNRSSEEYAKNILDKVTQYSSSYHNLTQDVETFEQPHKNPVDPFLNNSIVGKTNEVLRSNKLKSKWLFVLGNGTLKSIGNLNNSQEETTKLKKNNNSPSVNTNGLDSGFYESYSGYNEADNENEGSATKDYFSFLKENRDAEAVNNSVNVLKNKSINSERVLSSHQRNKLDIEAVKLTERKTVSHDDDKVNNKRSYSEANYNSRHDGFIFNTGNLVNFDSELANADDRDTPDAKGDVFKLITI